MVPSLYKDGELHTVKPLADENIIVHPDATDNNDGVDGTTPSTSSNFTFSRGSNLAATRVDVNGLIEKGRENLLLYSQDFSNAAWSKTNLSLTANQTDPLGGTNAFLFTSTSASNNLFVQSLSNQNKVCSIYAKAGNRSIFGIVNNSYGNGATFDLSAETAASSGQGSLAVIEDVGNGWYRCSVYFSLGTQFLVVLSDVNGSGYSNGDTISFFGSQMELGTIATDYIETTTTSVSAGILEDMPRLDYSGSCPSLLLEPQRANLITHSEYLANYPVNRGSVSSNAATSPEGVQNAASLVPTTDNGDHTIQSTNSLSATTYTISCFAKNNGNDISLTLAYNSSNWTGCIFDLVNGEAKTPQQRGSQSVCTADIESYGDGWYRCSITATLWTAYAGWFTFVSLVNDADGSLGSSWGRQSFVGVPSETAYLYGLEIEQGSYPTSYIPTYGTSQTRSGESCVATSVSDLIGQEQGTLFLEAKGFADEYSNNTYTSITNSTGSNRIIIGIASNSNQLRIVGVFGGVSNGGNNYTITDTTTYFKVAVKYYNSTLDVFVNGIKQTSQSFAGFSNAVNAVRFDDGNGALPFEGDIKQRLIFPTALTDSECIALTTL